MKQKQAKCIALAIIIIVPLIYFIRFGLALKMPLSVEQEVWG